MVMTWVRWIAFVMLVVTVPMSVSATDDLYVRVNQVGYGTSNLKIATAFAREKLPAKFDVVDAATQSDCV